MSLNPVISFGNTDISNTLKGKRVIREPRAEKNIVYQFNQPASSFLVSTVQGNRPSKETVVEEALESSRYHGQALLLFLTNQKWPVLILPFENDPKAILARQEKQEEGRLNQFA